MKKVLVIAGPTASGKTSFSIRMAKLMGAEIISGDSIQVYKGLDIGSGKVTEEEMDGVKHYLIDILNTDESYSAADFQKMARDIIDHNDKPVIICGGTGLYLKSCLYDYQFSDEEGPSTDPALDALDNDALYALLKEADPVQAEKIHPNNRRRVMRSLTILQRSGRPQSEAVAEQNHEMVYDTFIAGCTMPREVLYDRINRRVQMMFDNGLQKEVEQLVQAGVSFDSTCMKGIGYREWQAYFEGTSTPEEVKEQIQTHSRQFAKRQYTWLNHQMPVHWFESVSEEDSKRMEQEIMSWFREES